MTSPAFFSVVSRFVLQFQKLGTIPNSRKGSEYADKKQMLELLGGKAVKENQILGGGVRACVFSHVALGSDHVEMCLGCFH